MKKALLIIALLVPLIGFTQQANFHLKSEMNGELVLNSGNITNFWGYGYMGDSITFPSPLLEVYQGDSVNIEFTNLSNEAHTIHMHGLDVSQLNDGVPQTSFFVYINDTVNYSFMANHPGTFLYHCHVTTTLHLTMGMYGMFVVKYPGDILFENGPGFNKEYQFLMSDLELSVNNNPAAAFPFHEIYPNYFMVNGKSGEQLSEDIDQQINAHIGDSIALRLGSLAYSKVKYIFPEGSNPITYMSDGRVLSEALSLDTLELYPGERFSVIMKPDENLDGNIEVQYYSMVNKEYLSSAYIGINHIGDPNNLNEQVMDYTSFTVHPNPITKFSKIVVSDQELELSLFSLEGKLLRTQKFTKGVHPFNVAEFSNGIYILKDSNGYTKKIVIE